MKMSGVISRRLFPILQLTRMALVFTAISNSLCTLLIWTAARHGKGEQVFSHIPWQWAVAIIVMSTGLYGFGMSLNDIIDRRRDRQISPNRPIPSGRVSIATAHAICFALLVMALGAGLLFRAWGGPDLSLSLVIATLAFIWFYDVAGKYLVGPGLVTLGLVRFAQALIPSLQETPPYHPLIWHPLLLLNHVALLSAVCYGWEEKRPVLNARHWAGVILSLAAIDAAAIWLIGTRGGPGTFAENLHLDLRLLAPAAAALAFVALAWQVRRRSQPGGRTGDDALRPALADRVRRRVRRAMGPLGGRRGRAAAIAGGVLLGASDAVVEQAAGGVAAAGLQAGGDIIGDMPRSPCPA
jgi:4-hydroxybenzoate polyprenyltransferase